MTNTKEHIESNLKEVEYFLVDEQERAIKCEDPETKVLLERRCVMWENVIRDLKQELQYLLSNNVEGP